MDRARGHALHFVENGAAFHGHFPQLYTPVQLNRYGGNTRDPDPLYDCGPVSQRPLVHQLSAQS
jgi:hypothetical protein